MMREPDAAGPWGAAGVRRKKSRRMTDGAVGGGLEAVRWRDHRAGREAEAPIRNVFLFVGADPATEWLQADLRGWTALTAADRQSENVSRASRAFGGSLADACNRHEWRMIVMDGMAGRA